MDDVTKLGPLLWDMARNKRKFTVNLVSKDNEITVSIKKGKRWLEFKNKNITALLAEVEESLVLA
jgi:hypothetical protein